MMVEPAAAEDLPAIIALEEAFEKPWSRESWLSELEGSGRLVLVAREPDGQVVGVAGFQLVAELAELNRIVVAPSQRRNGLARVMLVTGLQWAAESGAERMLLEVDAENVPALRLYRGYGFREISQRRDYYGAGCHASILERDLAGSDIDAIGMWDEEAS